MLCPCLGENAMAKRKEKPVNWDAMDREVYNLRYERISPDERLKKAGRLAEIYRKAGKPLPDRLAVLV